MKASLSEYGFKESSRKPKSLQERGAATLDRMPPHSEGCEMGVLGCCLLSPNECLDECITKFGTDGKEVFYDFRHQTIYESLVTLRNENTGIDLITVQQRLKDQKILEGCGGIAYLSQLQDSVPSVANLGYYLDHVREKYLLRKMIQTCSGVVGRIYEYEGEVEQLLDQVEKEVLAVNAASNTSTIPSTKEFLAKAINNIETAYNNQGVPTGIATGFSDFDGFTNGLHTGEMAVIAARPSIGKTALAINIAEHAAIINKIPVGVFSLEMKGDSLVERMLASIAKVNVFKCKKGFMTQGDMPKLLSANGKIASAPIYIDETSGLSVMQLRARARRMVQQYGIKLFVIDYLQLLHSDTIGRNENREREIADISCGVKSMAKELDVAVLVLSQLNRESEKTGGKPKMSQMRESGSIEQDADLVGLLYKPNGSDDDDPSTQAESDAGFPTNLLIAKQRNGPANVTVNFTFLKQYTRFEQAAKIAPEDMPDQSQFPN